MGFPSRLTLVRYGSAPIARRVAALCDALAHSHLGFYGGMNELERRFGIVIGQPTSGELLIQAADYLLTEWIARRGPNGVVDRSTRGDSASDTDSPRADHE